jgi:hypothetical protein
MLGETEEERAAGMAIAYANAGAAAARASDAATLQVSAMNEIAAENARMQDSAEVVAARAAAKKSSGATIALVIAGIVSVGLVGYAVKQRGRNAS